MTLTLYRSGSIYSPATPRATAALVDSVAGEIVWVGTDEAAARLGNPDEELDLDGRLMVPAFVDAWVRNDGPTTLRAAVAQGVGALHVLPTPETVQRTTSGDELPSSAVPLVRYEPVDGDSLDPPSLTQRYEQQTAAGEQVAVVVRDADVLGRVVAAATAAAGRVGLPRFISARHRLHIEDGLPAGVIEDLARLGLVLCFGAGAGAGAGAEPGSSSGRAERPLRELAAAGVAFAFGSARGRLDPWGWVRGASGGGGSAISARAAFAAATRGGHRVGRNDEAGLLRAGAPATFAVWEFEGALVVRSPDDRVAAWSTDRRAATPGLPDLTTGSPPRCRRTVVDGVPVFDDGLRAS